jgi:hypothetical protein
MNRTRLCVFLFIIACGVAGCDQAQRKPMRVSTEGIKMSDLEPLDKPEMPPNIHFRIYTFILSEQMLAKSDNIFEILDKDPLTFVSSEAFKANGFATGYAKGNLWGQLGNRLKQADAVGVKDTAMIVYDDKGDDLVFGTLNERVTIDYFTSAEDSFETDISPGKLAWRIAAAAIEDKPMTAKVSIAAVSKPYVTRSTSSFLESRKPKAVIYDVSRFALEMNPGDFLVLAPEKYDPEISLETLGLTASGEFEVLGGGSEDTADAQTENLTLGRLLFKVHGQASVRFFVVVCIGVGN